MRITGRDKTKLENSREIPENHERHVPYTLESSPGFNRLNGENTEIVIRVTSNG